LIVAGASFVLSQMVRASNFIPFWRPGVEDAVRNDVRDRLVIGVGTCSGGREHYVRPTFSQQPRHGASTGQSVFLSAPVQKFQPELTFSRVDACMASSNVEPRPLK
jgi:hypothetical protein